MQCIQGQSIAMVALHCTFIAGYSAQVETLIPGIGLGFSITASWLLTLWWYLCGWTIKEKSVWCQDNICIPNVFTSSYLVLEILYAILLLASCIKNSVLKVRSQKVKDEKSEIRGALSPLHDIKQSSPPCHFHFPKPQSCCAY